MKHGFTISLAFMTLASLLSCSKQADNKEEQADSFTEYYFDSSYTGTDQKGSLLKPFNSLNALDTLKIDRNIRIKCGSVFKGHIKVVDVSGITISSYGDGARPKIDGDNLTGSAIVYLKNCSDITVSGIELYDSDVTSRGDKRGVLIDSDPSVLTTYSNITIEDMYIHDIYGELDEAGRGGSTAAKKCGGIHVWTTSGYGRYDNLLIRNNQISGVDCNGISIWYKPGTDGASKISPYSDDFKKYAYTNVRITGNEISNTGKNCVFVRNLYGGVIDHNVWFDNSYRCHAGNALCTSYVDGLTVEYNEGFLNRANNADGEDYQDGCMLDADLQSKKVIFQYNLSHDNTFGLFLNCDGAKATDPGAKDSVIVRYNLSINDKGIGRGIIHVNYYVASLEMHNNTIITKESADQTRIFHAKKNRGPYRFYNNLIYDRSGKGVFTFEGNDNGKFSDNCYYSTKGSAIDATFKSYNKDGIYANPMLKGTLPTDTEKIIGIGNVGFGMLETDSPCLNAGKEVSGVTKDFFGNNYGKSIGCCSR